MGVSGNVFERHAHFVDLWSDTSGHWGKLLEVEAVDAGGIASEHGPHLIRVDPCKGVTQGFGGVGISPLDVRVILAPHDFVDANVVAEGCLVGAEEAGADEAVVL